MSTAELIDHPPPDEPVREKPHKKAAGRTRGKPPLALRPLHRMWRRTIDEIVVSEIELPVRALPAGLRGLVACQISDFHVDRDEDLERLQAELQASLDRVRGFAEANVGRVGSAEFPYYERAA